MTMCWTLKAGHEKKFPEKVNAAREEEQVYYVTAPLPDSLPDVYHQNKIKYKNERYSPIFPLSTPLETLK